MDTRIIIGIVVCVFITAISIGMGYYFYSQDDTVDTPTTTPDTVDTPTTALDTVDTVETADEDDEDDEGDDENTGIGASLEIEEAVVIPEAAPAAVERGWEWSDSATGFLPAGDDIKTYSTREDCRSDCDEDAKCLGITYNDTTCWQKSVIKEVKGGVPWGTEIKIFD